jgi:membrane-bound lytic murein transglycosylase F
MIAQGRLRLAAFFAAFALIISLSACDRAPLPLPNAGKEQQKLVVLIPPGPLTYETLGNSDKSSDESGESPASGLEHDLVRAFAESLGVPVRFIVAPASSFQKRLIRHEAHLAVGWLTPDPKAEGVRFSTPYLVSGSVLVAHEANPPPRQLAQLDRQTVIAIADSQQHRVLLEMQKQHPRLVVETYPAEMPLDLLEAVATRKIALALVDKAVLDIGLNFFPMLQAGPEIGSHHPIAWMFPADGDPALVARAQDFLAEAQGSLISRVHDRYLGHVKRLDALDVTTFTARIATLLPRYRAMFEEAGRKSDLDWRLLAALSYQESHWNPLNTSPTGVRGMMMLTTETADRLGVRNRLDPKESILGGARYVNFLKANLPANTPEPDRTWLALAAYNIGPGHFNAARTIARQLKVDADSWFEMKKVLPLLARPRYYSRLKSGRARGGEAVILTENVRIYYDILLRHTPYAPLPPEAPTPGLHPPGKSPGLPLHMEVKKADTAPAS